MNPAAATATNRKVQVVANGSPQTDRYVCLTTSRLLATDLYVVGVVDGTGRLADPKSLLTTPDYARARKHANALVERMGGEAEPPDLDEFLADRAVGWKKRALEFVGPVEREPNGRYAVRFCRRGRQSRSRMFDTKQEAVEFHARLTKELESKP